MKILHVGKYFPPHTGGMETCLRDLMNGLAAQGIDTVALVHASRPGLKSRDEHIPGTGRVVRCAVWLTLLFTPVSPSFPLWMNRLLRTHRPDILHLHLPNVSAFWALLLPAARRVPWVLHWHSDVLPSRHSLGLRLFYRLYRPFENALLRRARTIIVTSPPYMESSRPLRRWHDKCRVVPLGLNPARLPPAVEIRQSGDGTLRVLSVGRLSYYKGLEYLIRALPAVPAAVLDLAGEGEQRERLQALVQDLGLEDRVVFHGKVSDSELARLYDNCDCLCLPSIERTEAFGLVLLEAMSRGRPVIASDVPGSGIGWVVRQGECGILVNPADSAALAAAMAQLAGERDTLNAMGGRGRQRFLEYFHISRSVETVIDIYRKAGTGRFTKGSALNEC